MTRAILAFVMIAVSVWVLELARTDVNITRADAGQTPVTKYAMADSKGPVVVVAHGFAGSQQMMQGYALPLARAGYRVFVFEFLGHGRNPLPMSGDLTSVEGTTRLLVNQTNEVIDSLALQDQPVALLGHSMATDILVRVASNRTDVGPVVLISAFSQLIDATRPETLLLITGAWEPGLRAFGKEALQMVSATASEGDTVSEGSVTRRAVAAPFSEHVSVLQNRIARQEAIDWLDRAYGRSSNVSILPTGWAILALLAGLVLLFRCIANLVPTRAYQPTTLSGKQFAVTLLLPLVVTPLMAVPLKPDFLPVLVADYLGLHLLIFGTLQLLLLRTWGVRAGQFSLPALLILLLWSGLFGAALDRYAANFWPTPERLWIIAALMLGTLPYMLADAVLTARTALLKRLAVRLSFLLSLGIAVALDFEGLFFLIMIAPIMVLFYLVFGTMGRDATRVTGPLSSGLALGCVLAWALGVSFPLFQS